jgi:hypothetical protein
MSARVAATVALLLALAPIAVAQTNTNTPSPEKMTVQELYSVMNERDRAINQRFELQDKAVNAALAAAKEAVTAALVAAKEAVAKAEFAAEKRFDAVNEFRATLRDQQATLVSRVEYNAKISSIDEKISLILARQSADLGKSEGSQWLWALIGGVIMLMINVGGLYIAFTKKGT